MNEYLIDLASARFGGRVLETSDQFFGPAERLIADARTEDAGGGRPDGWETRRRRSTGHEWTILRLGLPGVIREVAVEAPGFAGSLPERISVEAIDLPGDPHLVDLVRRPDRWIDLAARQPVDGEGPHRFAVEPGVRATHVRLVLFPDGGISRLRVRGEPVPPQDAIGAEVDLAGIHRGGLVVDASDAHFGSPTAMLLDERHRQDPGWLTRRRRDGGSDWAVIRLAGPATLNRIVVDTRRFVGNAPEACSIAGAAIDGIPGETTPWTPLVPTTPLDPDERHEFTGLPDHREITHLRLSIHPDGGIGRFQAFGVAERPWDEA
jgi:allantoicase